jgi:hypothetical protein
MSLYFYKPTNPAQNSLTGHVGSGISTGRFVGTINEIFAHVPAPPSGTDNVFYQYRKVYIKNTYLTTVAGVGAWIEAGEHPEQLDVGLETTANQFITSPTGAPTSINWIHATGYRSALQIGSLAPSASSGIWIRQTLSGIEQPDGYVAAILYSAGVVL